MNPNSPILLRIDASVRTRESVSRRLGDAVQQAWLARHPGGQLRHRDLAREPLAHIVETTVQGYYTPAAAMTDELRAATATSDALIAELKRAHTVLIAAPIYNFNVPSALKSWIDQIVRIGHTFAYEDGQFRGLVQGPRAVLALAYGAPGYREALESMDHLRPYLTQMLGFIGISDIDVVSVEGTTGGDAEANLQAGLARASTVFASAAADSGASTS